MDCEISKDTRESFPDDWPEWVLICLQRLNDAEGQIGDDFLDNADDWVFQLLVDTIKTLMPTTSFSGKQSGPEFLGSVIGHQERLLSNSETEQAMEISLEALELASQKIEAALNTLAPQVRDEIEKKAELYTEPFMSFADGIEDVIDDKINIMIDCIKLASEQEQNDKIDFFKGYSKALSIPLYDGNGQIIHQKILTDVSTIMVMYWRQIDEMENLPKVYDWARSLFPKKALNWDQFRKMCNRKGLQKAPPGRPKIGTKAE